LRNSARANPEGLKMTSSPEFKTVGDIAQHVERAMRNIDACIVANLNGQAFRWLQRKLETTGIILSNPLPYVPGIDSHDLAASVRIAGEIKRKDRMIDRIEALVEFVGSEVPHDPSGNLIKQLRVRQIQVKMGCPKQTYVFVEGCVPGDDD
jgi:hypothetical protein